MKIIVSNRQLVLLILFLTRIISSTTANLAFIGTALYAFRSRHHAIVALFLCFVFINMNTDIFPGASTAEVTRYLIVVAAFLTVMSGKNLGRKLLNDRIMLILIVFFGYVILHSIFFSFSPVISFLKITIWTVAFLTLIRGWSSISEEGHGWAEKTIYVILSIIVVISLFSVMLPQAYVPRTNYLRGVLGHSQALGVTAVIVAVWSFMRAVSEVRPRWMDLGVFVLAALAILYSGARTALVALPLTLIIVCLLSLLRIGQLKTSTLRGLSSWRFMTVAGIGLVTLYLQKGYLWEVLLKNNDFMSDDTVDLATLYMLSRGGLIGEMWANIYLDPLIGIGFGIASSPHGMVVTYAGGIPISALVEKGVTVIAVWEEIGLVGLMLFVILMLAIFVRSIHARPERVAVFIAIFLVNFGEGSLLSSGGIGLLQLVLLGWITSRNKQVGSIYARRRTWRRPFPIPSRPQLLVGVVTADYDAVKRGG